MQLCIAPLLIENGAQLDYVVGDGFQPVVAPRTFHIARETIDVQLSRIGEQKFLPVIKLIFLIKVVKTVFDRILFIRQNLLLIKHNTSETLTSAMIKNILFYINFRNHYIL